MRYPEEQPVKVIIEKAEKGTVVQLEGRLNSTTAPEFEKTLLGVIDGGATQLALDLTGLEMVSSAGLRIILVGARRIKKVEGCLALFGLSPTVREVFDISGFSQIITIAASRDEALASLHT